MEKKTMVCYHVNSLIERAPFNVRSSVSTILSCLHRHHHLPVPWGCTTCRLRRLRDRRDRRDHPDRPYHLHRVAPAELTPSL